MYHEIIRQFTHENHTIKLWIMSGCNDEEILSDCEKKFRDAMIWAKDESDFASELMSVFGLRRVEVINNQGQGATVYRVLPEI